jgi:nucleoid DNA-binding protein
MALPLVTQTQLVEEISEATGQSKSDVRVTLAALEDVLKDSLKDCKRVKVAGVTVEPKLRKASKARMGRNPQTGEAVKISAKPASVKIKARVSKQLQEVAPSTKKLASKS